LSAEGSDAENHLLLASPSSPLSPHLLFLHTIYGVALRARDATSAQNDCIVNGVVYFSISTGVDTDDVH